MQLASHILHARDPNQVPDRPCCELGNGDLVYSEGQKTVAIEFDVGRIGIPRQSAVVPLSQWLSPHEFQEFLDPVESSDADVVQIGYVRADMCECSRRK